MDLHGRLYALNHTPERVAARQQRRASAHDGWRAAIGDAVGATRTSGAHRTASTRTSQLSWALESHDAVNDAHAGVAIGAQHPGTAAIAAVRGVLGSFSLPVPVSVRYLGMSRASGRGGHEIGEGTVHTELSFRTLSGVNRSVDVPVSVVAGHVLAPVVMLDQGYHYPITQDALTDLLRTGTFMMDAPTRETMYSPPPDAPRPPQRAPLIRPGLFGLGPSGRPLVAAYIASAVRGTAVAPLVPFAAARAAATMESDSASWDPAERPVEGPMAGDDVTLTRALDVTTRGGERWHLTQGTEARVVRDAEGDGRWYYVWFPEINFTTRVPGDALS